MLVVLLATLLDRALGITAMVFQTATTFYCFANEGLSILENAVILEVPFPKKIKQALETVKENADEKPPDNGSDRKEE